MAATRRKTIVGTFSNLFCHFGNASVSPESADQCIPSEHAQTPLASTCTTETPHTHVELNTTRTIGTYSVIQGRRIVDLSYFGRQFDRGCTVCETSFRFDDIRKEDVYGGASVITIECSRCGNLGGLMTSETTKRASENKRGGYDVNTKMALGMVHAGIGPTQINAFLTTVNIPPVSSYTLKKHERIIGPKLEQFVEKSCLKASTEERDMTKKTTSPTDVVDVTVSYDMGWQKAGKAHNSLTGVGHAIGKGTKKVLSYATRCLRCSFCAHARRWGKKPRKHDCRANWMKSSKAMEGDVAKQLAQEAPSKAHVRYAVIVGDEDASTLNQIKQIDPNVIKFSDTNHIKRSFHNKLENLRLTKKHNISLKVTSSIEKNFVYALNQNKNDPEGLKKNLEAIVPHLFGEHDNCGQWCGYISAPETYKHRNLPKGKDLTGQALRENIAELLKPYIDSVDKIAPSASSQKNESLNNVIASKANKRLHFGSSESNDFRVASAVAQMNEGRQYVPKVLQAANLSPGHHCVKYTGKEDRKRKHTAMVKESGNAKRRRAILKIERKQMGRSQCVREGTTYESNCGLNSDKIYVYEIPNHIVRPDHEKCRLQESTPLIYFDLETTGLGHDAEIVQISGVNASNDDFNSYIMPERNICKKASEVTGLEIQNYFGTRQLLYNGNPVTTTDLESAVMGFITWISLLNHPAVLIAHNGKSFDSFHFTKALLSADCFDYATQHVSGYSDSLRVFKTKFPDRSRGTFAQTKLCSDLLNYTYPAHNSQADVHALKALVEGTAVTKEEIRQESFTLKSSADVVKHQIAADSRKSSFVNVPRAALSTGMVSKLSNSGLCMNDLHTAFRRDNTNGIKLLLSENVDGKPRITTRQTVVKKLNEFLMKHN